MIRPGCTIDVTVDFRDWLFGWADCFAFMGIGVLSLGPLSLTVTWPLEA